MSREPVRIKRFYKSAAAGVVDDGYVVLLDGRAAKTASRNPIKTSRQRLMCAIIEEWDAQGEHINRASMPLTGMLSAAIDGGGQGADEWRQEIVKYLGSDLVCYRADAPQSLAERQSAAWDIYIDFLRQEFGAMLVTTAGVVAVGQPDASIKAVGAALEGEHPETLFALQLATAISGSAVMALALWKGAFAAPDIFEASRIDEHFQAERWGLDEETQAREAQLREDFLHVARFLSLLKMDDDESRLTSG